MLAIRRRCRSPAIRQRARRCCLNNGNRDRKNDGRARAIYCMAGCTLQLRKVQHDRRLPDRRRQVPIGCWVFLPYGSDSHRCLFGVLEKRCGRGTRISTCTTWPSGAQPEESSHPKKWIHLSSGTVLYGICPRFSAIRLWIPGPRHGSCPCLRIKRPIENAQVGTLATRSYNRFLCPRRTQRLLYRL